LVHVRARDTTKGLHAAEIREATLRIAVESQRSASITTLPVSSRPTGARWPWWLGWLVASAALWWLERSRAGRVVHDT
jgi:hypothetical protein